MEDYDVLKVI